MIQKFRRQLTTALGGNSQGPGYSMKGIIATFLFGAICLVFVLFGLSSHQATGVGAAARVNNTLVSIADFQGEVNRIEQMYAPLFGGKSMGDAQRQFMQQQALESLITNELIVQGAKEAGIYSTPPEIRDVISKDITAFQQDGVFQKELYLRVLEANHLNPGDFESKIAKDKINQRTRRVIEASVQPLKMEIAKSKALAEIKMNVFYALLDKDQLSKTYNFSDADIAAELAKPDFKKKVEDDFKMSSSSYSQEEQVKASHILIKAEKGNKASEELALKKIKEIQAKTATEDFGKLAAEFSEDTGSKANRGELGTFGKGKMVPEFEQTVFSLPVGKVSEPVKTDFGYHLIKVTEHMPAKIAELKSVEAQIAKKLMADQLVDNEVKVLDTALAAKDFAAVETELKKLGLSWQETGPFDLNVEQVPKLDSQVASQAAFELSGQNTYLNHIVRDGAKKFVLKFKEIKTETSPIVKTGDELAKNKSMELFTDWIEFQKKSAEIEKNPALLEQNPRRM